MTQKRGNKQHFVCNKNKLIIYFADLSAWCPCRIALRVARMQTTFAASAIGFWERRTPNIIINSIAILLIVHEQQLLLQLLGYNNRIINHRTSINKAHNKKPPLGSYHHTDVHIHRAERSPNGSHILCRSIQTASVSCGTPNA